MTHEQAFVAEYERWRRARDEIMRALTGDPVAVSENWKELERMRQREQESDERE